MLKCTKKVIGHLNKCYSLAEYDEDGRRYMLCAAEKEDPCYQFDREGNRTGTMWEGPGGVMSMEQYKDVLLATWKFYSPNNSAEAKIVYYTKGENGYDCHVLCDLPFVHRFGIISADGRSWLIACTLKSAHAFKDDWTCPGRIWAAELPEDLKVFSAENQLVMKPLVSGLYRNHGFVKVTENGRTFALVGTENGIYRVDPPADGDDPVCGKILDAPASDMLYTDLDGDGERELFVLSPFHGDTVSIFKNGEEVYRYPEKLPFLHAITEVKIGTKTYAVTGNRQGSRDLLAFSWDPQNRIYTYDLLDQGAGAANCYFYREGGKDLLMAANRETDEIALYELWEE